MQFSTKLWCFTHLEVNEILKYINVTNFKNIE